MNVLDLLADLERAAVNLTRPQPYSFDAKVVSIGCSIYPR